MQISRVLKQVTTLSAIALGMVGTFGFQGAAQAAKVSFDGGSGCASFSWVSDNAGGGSLTCVSPTTTPGAPACSISNSTNGAANTLWFGQTSASISFSAPSTTTSYTVTATNATGSGQASTTVTVSSGTVTPPPSTASCPTSGVQNLTYNVTSLLPGSSQRLTTSGFTSNMVVGKFTTGSWSGAGYIRYGEYNGAPATHTLVLSTTPCDLTNQQPGWYASAQGNTLYYVMGMTYPGYPTLQPNTTYYVNVVNQDLAGNPTCNSGSTCDIFIEIQRP